MKSRSIHDWLTSTWLNPLDRSRATLRRNHHRLARDMTGKGLIISTATESSQIIGHVHGWIVGSPVREKESQKAQQRVASAMQGIYNDALIVVLSRATKPLEKYLKILPVIKTSPNVQIFTVIRDGFDSAENFWMSYQK